MAFAASYDFRLKHTITSIQVVTSLNTVERIMSQRVRHCAISSEASIDDGSIDVPGPALTTIEEDRIVDHDQQLAYLTHDAHNRLRFNSRI